MYIARIRELLKLVRIAIRNSDVVEIEYGERDGKNGARTHDQNEWVEDADLYTTHRIHSGDRLSAGKYDLYLYDKQAELLGNCDMVVDASGKVFVYFDHLNQNVLVGVTGV